MSAVNITSGTDPRDITDKKEGTILLFRELSISSDGAENTLVEPQEIPDMTGGSFIPEDEYLENQVQHSLNKTPENERTTFQERTSF